MEYASNSLTTRQPILFRESHDANGFSARAIDHQEPWALIAMKAVDDGYIEHANEFVRFIEFQLRRSG